MLSPRGCEDVAVVMTVPPPAAAALPLAAALLGAAAELAGAAAELAAAADELAGAAALLLLPLLHAAASIATPTAAPTPAASLADVDVRLITETRISLASRLAPPGQTRPAPQ